MGPKRARASRGASSSQNPPNSPQTRRDRRRQLFESRTCNPGRPVDLLGLEHLGTYEAFSEIDWEPFLFFQGPVPFDSMVDFYAGYDFNESTNTVSLQINTYNYSWTLDQFSTLLGLTNSGVNVFSNDTAFSSLLTQVDESQDTILQSVLAPAHRGNINSLNLTDQHLPENLRFWNKIILFNVLGRAGNLDRLGALQCYILYCLQHGIHINATYIVAHRMMISETHNQSLPFGYLIKNLFTNLQIPILGRTIPPATPLNEMTVNRMSGPPGQVQRRHRDPAPEANDQYAIPAGTISNRQMYSAFMDFRRNYDADQRMLHERMDADQRVIHDRMDDIEAELWIINGRLEEIEFVDSD